MHSFFVFFQKECLELIRTKRIFVLLCIFALFGMLGPVTARYMEDIINMAMGSALPLNIPKAAWTDSWGQFYNNLSQMGNICIIFLFMACVSGEKQSGSAALTLTKNLSPAGFVMAKFTAAAVMVLGTLIPAVGICYGYTYYLFGQAGNFTGILSGMAAFYIFVLTLAAVTVMCSTLSQSTVISAVLAFSGFIILTVSNYIPWAGQFMPGALLAKTAGLSAGESYSGIVWTVILSFGSILLCLSGSIAALKKQEI